MEKLTDEFKNLLTECIVKCKGDEGSMDDVIATFKSGVRTKNVQNELDKLQVCKGRVKQRKRVPLPTCSWMCFCVYLIFPITIALIFTPMFVPEVYEAVLEYVQETECVIESNPFVAEVGRPMFNCDVCQDLKEITIASDVSREEFIEKYAYTAVPVLVKNATKDWSALHTFTFKYFKDLYLRAEIRKEESREELEDNIPDNMKDAIDPLACQFFPYNTDFEDLIDAINMPIERAEYKPGEKPWYFGWSNCDKEIMKELRQHYQRPHFLPLDSETSSIDWMFMGGTGIGAPMHLDSVSRPSWQAQISGKKTWSLVPPPECDHICHSMNVTVHKGDIFVIDTNQWYHATYIHPGPISLTIGSEYD